MTVVNIIGTPALYCVLEYNVLFNSVESNR